MDEKRTRKLFDEARQRIGRLSALARERHPAGFLDGYDPATGEDTSSIDPRLARVFAAALRQSERRRTAYLQARYGATWARHVRRFSLFQGK